MYLLLEQFDYTYVFFFKNKYFTLQYIDFVYKNNKVFICIFLRKFEQN